MFLVRLVATGWGVIRALQQPDFARGLPDFDIMAIDKFPGGRDGFVVVTGLETLGLQYVPVVPDDVGPILGHFGGCRPGEFSHSFT